MIPYTDESANNHATGWVRMSGWTVEQHELLDMTRRIDRELSQLLPSRSAYRTTDDPIGTLAGLVLNVGARVYEDWVHARAAEAGIGTADWAAGNLGGRSD